ncbi:hypothetical protein ACLIKD_12055 [Azonexus sp. IMCC34842]|uniref:hypothetical protein n=1 Tax=Azonexus sp. IMCC34842 TaxID=3420950 RepID=UPI003D149A69
MREAVLLSDEFAVFQDDTFSELTKVRGCSVFGATADIRKYRAIAENAVVAIGANQLREVQCGQFTAAGFEFPTVAHHRIDFGRLGIHVAMVGGAVLGCGVWRLAGSALGCGVTTIGACVVLAPGEGVSQC